MSQEAGPEQNLAARLAYETNTKLKSERLRSCSRPRQTKFDSMVRHAQVRRSCATSLRINCSIEKSRRWEIGVQQEMRWQQSLQKQSSRFGDAELRGNVDLWLGR